jgi:hypothetical protein
MRKWGNFREITFRENFRFRESFRENFRFRTKIFVCAKIFVKIFAKTIVKKSGQNMIMPKSKILRKCS